ncbi:MAG: hypothetical protein ACI9YO_000371 [Gammaproteobacteria bacterium]|jgi:hypothetical protein
MKTLILLSILFSASVSAGGIHKWINSEGNTHYGDAPPVPSTTKQVRPQGVPSDLGKALPRLAKNKQNNANGSLHYMSTEEITTRKEKSLFDIEQFC